MSRDYKFAYTQVQHHYDPVADLEVSWQEQDGVVIWCKPASAKDEIQRLIDNDLVPFEVYEEAAAREERDAIEEAGYEAWVAGGVL